MGRCKSLGSRSSSNHDASGVFPELCLGRVFQWVVGQASSFVGGASWGVVVGVLQVCV